MTVNGVENSELFDYPMKVWEIHKWLIGKTESLQQVERAIRRLKKKGRIDQYKDYYFLSGKQRLVRKRMINEKLARALWRKAYLVGMVLKFIPWVKLIGVSGGLAMNNTNKNSDIDFLVVTEKNRLWLSRLLILGVMIILGLKRKPGCSPKEAAGKICVNTVLDVDGLFQNGHDLYIAHEVLQMRVIWQREGIYSKYLSKNSWAFRFVPNWKGEKD
jgi:hypothetical protein